MTQDLLFEIGTEELPAKGLENLAKTLCDNIRTGLTKAELKFADISYYATPRRLAILIHNLAEKQPSREIERKGPAINAAFDAQNNPTPALQGFARSCNTKIEQLQKLETAQGAWFVYRFTESGKTIFELMPEIIQQALSTLPIPKPMRWSDLAIAFSRPVHWIVLMYGDKIIPATILGKEAANITYGHRFLHPQAITIDKPADYVKHLDRAFVIADFAERRKFIEKQILQLAQVKNAQALIPQSLLDEVTGLVEWPIGLFAQFDAEFLAAPREALIAAMNAHQKSFAVEDDNKKLLPGFITISNLQSKDPQEVIRGNARVMRARLADAKFFYEQDCKHTSAERLDDLKNIVFQAGLGSLYDKSQRVAELAKLIAKPFNCEIAAEQAGLLCKADLVSDMVGEFPELQGIMGYYYALHDQEDAAVATAIKEHYLPRFAGDDLPQSQAGCAVALADRLDTLIGIFGINKIPTGDKDPFGLRRAAVGVLRILIEKQFSVNLLELLKIAYQNYNEQLSNKNAVEQVHEYILERLRAWYQEKNIAADTLAAVLAVQKEFLLDIDQRVHAVQVFRQLPEAKSLAEANKRVSNLLTKSAQLNATHFSDVIKSVDAKLFQHDVEQTLLTALQQKIKELAPLANDYTQRLTALANLKQPIDGFFDSVLVMDENEKLRHNRLALVAAARALFLEVADISLLQI